MDNAATPSSPRKRHVAAWASWDFGSAAFNAVIVTFVFAVYLTDVVGQTIDSSISPATWLSIAMTVAGVAIAVTAPITGRRADAGGRRRRSLGVWTAWTIAGMACMFFVRPSPAMFLVGLLLLSLCSISFQFAEVSYFAMLRDVSTPKTTGRASGFGWAAGYVGGIGLLLAVFILFIAGDGETRGALALSTAESLNIRLIALAAAAWFAVFALPILFWSPRQNNRAAPRQVTIKQSYVELWQDIVRLWRTDRNTIRFLLASAVFRDGVASVFAFGAILAVTVYGIEEGQVLMFGIAANLVAALGSVMAGFLDDTVGPKPVIIVSLVVMIATSFALFAVSGPLMFWIFGLLLTTCVGPVQSASRSYLARLAPAGREGEMFGLYATTGRAVSFLGPAAFAIATGLTGHDKAGVLGVAAVLILGLILTLRVRSRSIDVSEETPSAPLG